MGESVCRCRVGHAMEQHGAHVQCHTALLTIMERSCTSIAKQLNYLGCIIAHGGTATLHLEHRGSIFLGAWDILSKQSKCLNLPRRANAKLYEQLIAPTLLHGATAYALTCENVQYARQLQNIVQRNFVKAEGTDVVARWRAMHSKLRELRLKGALPDVIDIWENVW